MNRCRKLLSAMLALCLILGLPPCSALAEESQTGLENFTERNAYTDGQFTDVAESSWYYENVKSVYELGLMKGKLNQLFDPDGSITIAETVTLAVRLHAIYYGSAQPENGNPWYQPYIDYAVEKGIIQKTYGDYGRPATRLEFVTILSGALPESALEQKNQVANNAIPDVKATDPGAAEVYRFYRAGILTGNDAKGTFAPGSSIRRSETAAVIARMVKPELRKSVTLEGPDSEIQKAVGLGLVPEVPEDLNATIRYDQFCAMLTKVITLLYGEGEYLDKWNELAANAMRSSREMARGDGAFALLTAAAATGMDISQPNSGDLMDIGVITQGAGVDLFQLDNSLFPWLNQPYHNRDFDRDEHWAMDFANRYPWVRRSPVSFKCLMEYDEAYDMRYYEPFSAADAICAALRCYESWAPREYVKTTDVAATTCDASILTPGLLAKESSLPEPAQSALPSDWQGVYTLSKLSMRSRTDFRERDIYAAHKNGLNFMRVGLGFSTLGYPDYPSDKELVNAAELRDLDRLLAWAIKYDVHLCISMTALPGYEPDGEPEADFTSHDDNWPDAERWKLVRQYWVMLATRYKDIPSKYLSFSLCEEWSAGEAEHQKDFSERWGEIVSDIRAISPDRILMAGFATAGSDVLALAERTAELGVAVAAHPYFPNQLAFFSIAERAANGFDGELEWPMVWFPTSAFSRGDSPITISGELGGKKLTVYAFHNEQINLKDRSVITAEAGGKRLARHEFREGGAEDAMVISIPEGTKELTLRSSAWLPFYCMKLEGDFGVSLIASTSLLFGDDGSNDTASLVVDANGVWADKDGRLYDQEAVFRDGIEPFIEIAEKNAVGFMVNEFTLNNRDYEMFVREPIPMEAHLAYYADMIELFEERDIGYVLCNISAVGGNVLVTDGGHFENYADYPNYIGTETFVNSNGFTETFYVNNVLMDTIKKSIQP